MPTVYDKHFFISNNKLIPILKPFTIFLVSGLAYNFFYYLLPNLNLYGYRTITAVVSSFATSLISLKIGKISFLIIYASVLKYHGWMTNPKSLKTKIWGFCIKFLDLFHTSSTFSYQNLLPRQPLPQLNVTLDKWLAVSKDLLNDEDYDESKKVVEIFRKHDGPKLQRHLEKRKEITDNWLSDYWIQAAYLASRNSLTVSNNYAMAFKLSKERTPHFIARAASVLNCILRYHDFLMRNRVKPIKLNESVPICMAGYKYLFGVSRLPGEDIDSIFKVPNSEHIVVIRNGHYFILEFYLKEQNKKRRLNVLELREQIGLIVKKANDLGINNDPVASLTSQNRTLWFKNRKILRSLNKKTVDSIESSLFILCLDDFQPQSSSETFSRLLTGSGSNIWFDKCFNLMIFENSIGGCNIEHTFIDAWVFTTLGEYIICGEEYENGDIVKNDKHISKNLVEPINLKWNLDENLKLLIKVAFNEAIERINNFNLQAILAPYSKGLIKKMKLSPDGYIQMVFQLAFYRLYKFFPKTYEPATSRLFLLGRTETVHPISKYSIQFVEAMDNCKVTNEKRIQLLKQAIKIQGQNRLTSTLGQGYDRHLFALYCASRELGIDIPEIFKDKLFASPFILSTSQTPTKVMEYKPPPFEPECSGGGFGPYTKEVFGICYNIISDDILHINVSTWKDCIETDGVALTDGILCAMEDMKRLFF